MAEFVAVCEPYATPPSLTWVCATRGVVDRRFVLNARESGSDATWLAALRVLTERQGRPPDAVAVVSWAWQGCPADADALAADQALLRGLQAAVSRPGALIDEGGARARAELVYGVGAALGDQLHLGVGVRASGVRLGGRWRTLPDGRPWSADGLVVRPEGTLHGGRGWLRDYTWPDALAAAARLHGHDGAAHAGAMDSAAPLRPWLERLRHGGELAKVVAADAGDALGIALGGLLNLYDLPDVVLHLPSERLRETIILHASQTLARHSFERLREGLRWHAPTLGDSAVPLGAAQCAHAASV